MAFCQQCGAAASGRFCAQCGSQLDAPAETGPPKMPIFSTGSNAKPSPWLRIVLWCAGIAVILTLGGALWSTSSQGQTGFQVSDSSDAIPSKSDELADARRGGPTATQMAGNSDKWKGSYVRFPCKIINVIAGPAANAMCGRGVTATFDAAPPSNVDYSDPNAIDKAVQESEDSAQRQTQVMEDQAMVVLVGDKVGNFDGGQIVTITGEVMGAQSGRNGMGATLNYATVRVDYAE